jgi:hypothetical protein
VGSWAAHFSLPAQLGGILGFDTARLERMTMMSQFPDQVSALDATINGARAIATVSAYAPGVNGLRGQRALHALNGRRLSENLEIYLQIIRLNVGNDDVVAMALHPLVDSVFHARTVRLRGGSTILRSFDDGLGHAFDGSHPDFASEQQIKTATGALISAFQIIAGRQLTLQELRNANSGIDGIMKEARRQTDLKDRELDLFIPSDERMELNVRSVSDALLGGWGNRLLKPTPIQGFLAAEPITWELTVRETQRYLSSGGRQVSQVEASRFARDGMWAAAKVIDDYEFLTTGKKPGRPFSPKDLMDTVPWSFSSLLYPKMPATTERWSYRDIVPGYKPKEPSLALTKS